MTSSPPRSRRRSESGLRVDLIKVLNTSLPHPYVCENSVNIVGPAGEAREFDICVIDGRFVSDSEVDKSMVRAAVETKRKGVGDDGSAQAKDAFKYFPELLVSFATDFGEVTAYYRDGSSASLPGGDVGKVAASVTDAFKDAVVASVRPKKVTSEKDAIELIKSCVERVRKSMPEVGDATRTALMKKALFVWKTAAVAKDGDTEKVSEINFRAAAAYIVVDQLLFYHLLQKKVPAYGLLPLTSQDTDDPVAFKIFFDAVVRKTGDFLPVYGEDYDVVSVLPKTRGVVDALNDAVKAITTSDVDAHDSDFVGKVFHAMIPLEVRRPIAAYYTQSWAGRLLASLAIDRADAVVFDPACGSGTLLLEAYKRKTRLAAGTRGHKVMIENDIFGNDVTFFATHLAAMNLVAADLTSPVEKVNVTAADALSLVPKGRKVTLDDHVGKRRKKDSVRLGDVATEVEFGKVDVVVMNPPFSNAREMDKDLKAHVKRFFSENGFPESHDGKAGFHVPFIYLAMTFLEEGGVLAAVLPASTFNTDYGRKLCKSLTETPAPSYAGHHVKYVVRCDDGIFSDDCGFEEYVLVVEKGTRESAPKSTLTPAKATVFVTLKRRAVEADPDGCADTLRVFAAGEGATAMWKERPTVENEFFKAVAVPQSIIFNGKWDNFFSFDPRAIALTDKRLEPIYSRGYLKKVGSVADECEKRYGGEVRRHARPYVLSSGFHATHSEFLYAPNDDWDVRFVGDNAVFTARDADVPATFQLARKYLVPAIRRFRGVGMKASPDTHVISVPDDESAVSDLADFVRLFVPTALKHLKTKHETRTDAGKRVVEISEKLGEKAWYTHPHRNGASETKGRIFVGLKFRAVSRPSPVILSDAPCTASNNFYLLAVPEGLEEAVASFLNSIYFLRPMVEHGRRVGGSFYEFMVGDFKACLIPGPEWLASEPEKVRECIAAFDDFAANETLSLVDQLKTASPYRKRLDAAWAAFLGVDPPTADEYLAFAVSMTKSDSKKMSAKKPTGSRPGKDREASL